MHLSENAIPLKEQIIKGYIAEVEATSANVEFIVLPFFKTLEEIPNKKDLFKDLNQFISRTNEKSTIVVLTSPIFATDFCAHLNVNVYLKLWVAVKLENPIRREDFLTESHAALIILSRYKESLKHTKTRIAYTYCPSCSRTTKDYGGKKHLYHEFGTMMSDVWRDITVNFITLPIAVIGCLKDLFALSEYKFVNVYDQRSYCQPTNTQKYFPEFTELENSSSVNSILLNGDCIEQLKSIPDNSVDFCFADPPYNLKKKYESWNDGIDIHKYFEWCDQWLSELVRVVKHGRTLAILNIPQWCVRHFKYLNTILNYQGWIAWEALSMPVRMIMPAHYSILCFTKGKPRQIPALIRHGNSLLEQKSIETFSENFCIRPDCILKRKRSKIKDTELVSNLWWDIHRLKHNSRRVDHPCQLPPFFMYRLISLFTYEGELVLDPFNGVGTTTLTAQLLNRKYVGIELSEYYHNIAIQRHNELEIGLDPFRKNSDDITKAKNSPVARLKKQKYRVSKKILQLEVKTISKQLGKIPTKEEVARLSKYPIEYYESYFISWGEVTAAARTTGMVEFKDNGNQNYQAIEHQLRLFEKPTKKYESGKEDINQI